MPPRGGVEDERIRERPQHAARHLVPDERRPEQVGPRVLVVRRQRLPQVPERRYGVEDVRHDDEQDGAADGAERRIGPHPEQERERRHEEQRHGDVGDDEPEPDQGLAGTERGAQRRARRRPPEEDAARQVGHRRQQDEREQRQREGHDELLPEQLPARHGRREQVAQARPAGLAGDGVTREQREHDHEQEPRGDEQREEREIAGARRREVDEPGRPAPVAAVAELESRDEQERQDDEEAQGQPSPAARPLAAELDAQRQRTPRGVPRGGAGRRGAVGVRGRRDRRGAGQSGVRAACGHQASPTSARNASSSPRWGAMRSTARPSATSTRTSSLRGVPTSFNVIPAGVTATSRAPSTDAATWAARSGWSTSTTSAVAEPTRSLTSPWATSLPWCITTTWSQVCSTSDRRWLEMTTVRPVAAYPPSTSRISRIWGGSSPFVG